LARPYCAHVMCDPLTDASASWARPLGPRPPRRCARIPQRGAPPTAEDPTHRARATHRHPHAPMRRHPRATSKRVPSRLGVSRTHAHPGPTAWGPHPSPSAPIAPMIHHGPMGADPIGWTLAPSGLGAWWVAPMGGVRPYVGPCLIVGVGRWPRLARKLIASCVAFPSWPGESPPPPSSAPWASAIPA
jgi:hypothetical protein